MKDIYTEKAPEPIGPYTQAKETAGFLFCSGQIAIDPETGSLTGEDVSAQTERVCANIGAVLEAAGLSLENVVKTTCYLVNTDDFAVFNAVYGKYFTSSPARSCVFVRALPKNALVEIEVTAERV